MSKRIAFGNKEYYLLLHISMPRDRYTRDKMATDYTVCKNDDLIYSIRNKMMVSPSRSTNWVIGSSVTHTLCLIRCIMINTLS